MYALVSKAALSLMAGENISEALPRQLGGASRLCQWLMSCRTPHGPPELAPARASNRMAQFVDKLARGTVAPAAMNKRGLSSKDAMGVDAQEMLALQLGHKSAAQKEKERKFRISINS